MPLVYAPRFRSRNGVGYATVRCWGAQTKRRDIDDIKMIKKAAEIDPGMVDAAAGEIHALLASLFGALTTWRVTKVAVGHSRRPDSFASQIAMAVADLAEAPFEQVFEERYVKGSSHPKANADLPPLRIARPPSGPTILVDDIMTSGFHMEEALTVLRGFGVPAFGVA